MAEGTDGEVHVPKAAELIASQLRRQIVMGERSEGEFFPSEAKLMGDLAVSRPTLRQAFRILENEKLVSINRGRNGGTRVSRPSIDAASRYLNNLLVFKCTTIDDVYQARCLLEPAAVADLAGRLDRPDLAELREHAQQRNSEPDPRQRHVLDEQFHVRLVKLTGNRPLAVYAELLAALLAPAPQRHAPSNTAAADGAKLDPTDAHLRVIDLIEAGAAQEASGHWRNHLEAIRVQLARSVDTGAALEL
jgi:DNA-binding FadR family transcriptional regulator